MSSPVNDPPVIKPPALLADALMHPQGLQHLTLAQWDLLVRQARHANLLGRLAVLADTLPAREALPEPVRRQLESALVLTRHQRRVVRWEVDRIRRALEHTNIPVVLLKGAAYVMADLPAAQGRLFQDIDIMVPRENLADVETLLRLHGWFVGQVTPYDQKYYRTWMHELPPLRHFKRNTVLDVHHSILPLTARLKPDAARLIEGSLPLAGERDVRVLAPVDMVLHSATHLFHDGELEHGLRDLVDLDSLLRHFATQAFWDELPVRARELDLARPLYYALHYTATILSTPVPPGVISALAPARPNPVLSFIMDALFRRALAPDHPSCDDRFTALARGCLYVRSHYLRMPLHLLIPHLLRKAVTERAQEHKA